MTKIILAPDKFKGSLTGMEFCDAVERGIAKETSDIELVKLPLADGGDGTIEILNYYLDGEIVSLEVHDPLYRKIKSSYLYSESKQTAYIEMAKASGICLLKDSEVNPMLTGTYGTGELIKNALDKGVKHIILGIGGSATNDAGLGMARALGYSFQAKDGQNLWGVGEDLIRLAFIDELDVDARLKDVTFEVACDVDNPLYGDKGAAYTYGPQKGANSEMVLELDAGLKNFSQVVKAHYKIDLQDIKGAGAAGGLGAGCMLFLKAELNSGIDLVKKEACFDTHIKGADWIISGEGKLDKQTFAGKVIQGVIDSIEQQKLALFCAVVDLSEEEKQTIEVDYLSETSSYAKNVDDSIRSAAKYLELAAEKFAKNKL